MEGLRTRDGRGQCCGERGLAGSTTPVDGDDRRPSLRGSDKAQQMRDEVGDCADLPLSDRRLLRLKLDGLGSAHLPEAAVADGLLVAMHRRSFQGPAHEGQVEEPSELLAGLRDGPDSVETIALMQVNRGRVARLDESDHGAVPGLPRGLDQCGQKPGTEAMSLSSWAQVDRVLDRAGVALIGVPGAGDREADDVLRLATDMGNESRSALDHGGKPCLGPSRVLLDVGPDGQGLPHGGIADLADGRGVRHGRRADPVGLYRFGKSIALCLTRGHRHSPRRRTGRGIGPSESFGPPPSAPAFRRTRCDRRHGPLRGRGR